MVKQRNIMSIVNLNVYNNRNIYFFMCSVFRKNLSALSKKIKKKEEEKKELEWRETCNQVK